MNGKIIAFINEELGVRHDDDNNECYESQYSYERIRSLKLKIQRERDKNVQKLQKSLNKNINLLEKGIVENLKEKKSLASERFEKNITDLR